MATRSIRRISSNSGSDEHIPSLITSMVAHSTNGTLRLRPAIDAQKDEFLLDNHSTAATIDGYEKDSPGSCCMRHHRRQRRDRGFQDGAGLAETARRPARARQPARRRGGQRQGRGLCQRAGSPGRPAGVRTGREIPAERARRAQRLSRIRDPLPTRRRIHFRIASTRADHREDDARRQDRDDDSLVGDSRPVQEQERKERTARSGPDGSRCGAERRPLCDRRLRQRLHPPLRSHGTIRHLVWRQEGALQLQHAAQDRHGSPVSSRCASSPATAPTTASCTSP